MSIQYVNAISNRLSLRPPQRESLEILARLCEIVSLDLSAPTCALHADRCGHAQAGKDGDRQTWKGMNRGRAFSIQVTGSWA